MLCSAVYVVNTLINTILVEPVLESMIVNSRIRDLIVSMLTDIRNHAYDQLSLTSDTCEEAVSGLRSMAGSTGYSRNAVLGGLTVVV